MLGGWAGRRSGPEHTQASEMVGEQQLGAVVAVAEGRQVDGFAAVS